MLIAGGRPWIRFTTVTAAGLRLSAVATGHDVAGTAYAAGFVFLAATVAMPAVRAWLRRLLGILIGLTAAATVATCGSVLAHPARAAAGRAVAVSQLRPPVITAASVMIWPWLAGAAGLIAIALAVLVAVRSAPWPAMGRRYDRAPQDRRPPAAGAARSAPEASAWDRLDRGEDPTV